jgi:hypothetical protein
MIRCDSICAKLCGGCVALTHHHIPHVNECLCTRLHHIDIAGPQFDDVRWEHLGEEDCLCVGFALLVVSLRLDRDGWLWLARVITSTSCVCVSVFVFVFVSVLGATLADPWGKRAPIATQVPVCVQPYKVHSRGTMPCAAMDLRRRVDHW